jgi:hypothetical protein
MRLTVYLKSYSNYLQARLGLLRLRNLKMQKTFPLFKRVKTIINSYKVDIWVLRGAEMHCGEELNLVYMGSEANRNYIASLIYGSLYNTEYLGKKWLWSSVEKKDPSSDLLIREVPPAAQNLFKTKRSFLIPTWINQTMDLSIDLDSWISKDRTLAHDRRKIKKYSLYPVITKDIDCFNRFYHDMYLPYMMKRFGNEASISEYALLKQLMEKGELLLVNQGEESIAGMLITYENEVPRLLVLGIKNADSNYMNQGAGGAAYQFAMQHIKEKGYVSLSLGSTRAFLKDGVLQHKEKWGVMVSNSKNKVFQLCSRSLNPAVRNFLINNPFICVRASDLTETVFINDKRILDTDEIEDLYKKYQLSGVKTLRICHFSSGQKIEEFNHSCK